MNSAIKMHGGKRYLAKQIVALFPPRCKNSNKPDAKDPGYVHYVEPYFGGGSVLFENDPEGISEVVNDINGALMHFWHVISDERLFHDFVWAVQAMPCAEQVFAECKRRLNNYSPFGQPAIESARDFFVVNRQSRQGLGKDFATLVRNRTRRGMNELASAWLSAIDGLPEVHARLKRVVVLCKDALKVIEQQDGPRTLFYLDPPYLHDTRSSTGEYGAGEMTEKQHIELLDLLAEVKGLFVLSGYRHKLYDRMADSCGWKRTDIPIDNKASGAKSKEIKIESLWRNY